MTRRTMLTRLGMGAMPLALVGQLSAANTAEERDIHYDTVRAMIAKELRIPADRSIKGFRASGYPNGELYADALRFVYARDFRTVAHRSLVKALEQEYEALKTKINVDTLPPKLQEDLKSGGIEEVRRFVRQIIGPKALNPDSPPPQVKYSVERSAQFKARVEQLISVTDNVLAQQKAKIDGNKEKEEAAWDLPEAEMQKVNQAATLMRFDYTNTLYLTYKALREVIIRSKDFGLDETLTSDVIEPWLHAKLSEVGPQFSDWDWNYAEYYPLLRHRLMVLMSEAIRLKQAREDLGKLTVGSYETVKDGFYSVIDLDLGQFPAKFRPGLKALQADAWADLVQWQIALGTPKALQDGAAIWDDFEDRRTLDLNDRDQFVNQGVGHLYIMAANLMHAKGDAGARDVLLTKLQKSRNFFKANAKLWITYFNSVGGTGGGDWGKQPTPMDPSVALNLARGLRNEARNTVDDKLRRSFYMRAATQLRNGVLGLPDSVDTSFADLAPSVFRSYCITLYELGMLHHATVAAKEGLQRMKPTWESDHTKGLNPWKDKKGEVTKSGKMVQTLANDFLTYSLQLRNRAKGKGSEGLLTQATAMLKIFDPANAGANLDKLQISLLIKSGSYDEAFRLLADFEKKNPKEGLWVAATYTMGYYTWFNAESGKTRKNESKIAELSAKLDESLSKLEGIVMPVIDGKKKVKPEDMPQYENQFRNINTIRITKLRREGRFEEVLALLNEDFWANPPENPELQLQMMKGMVSSCFQLLVKITKDDKLKMDPAVLQKHWPAFKLAYAAYTQVLDESPAFADDTVGTLRQMSALYSNVSKMAKYHAATGKDSDTKAEFAQMENDAKRLFADSFLPLIDEKTPSSKLLAVATTLWGLDDMERAVPVYELYLTRLAEEPLLKGFEADPQGTINGYAQAFNARINLRKYFERKGPKSITDLLIDDPNFIKNELRNSNVKEKDWSEKKRDFGLASDLSDEFVKLVVKESEFLPNKDELIAKANELDELVRNLSYAISVRSRLVEAYRRTGRNVEAVSLAQELYDYDPLNPTFMAMYIEGVIAASQEAGRVTQAELTEARTVALELRALSAPHRTLRDLYWTAQLQVLQLSHALGDTSSLTKSLDRNLREKNFPYQDLAIPETDPPEAPDQGVVRICERYLELYDLANKPRPFRIETNEKGVSVFIREGK